MQNRYDYIEASEAMFSVIAGDFLEFRLHVSSCLIAGIPQGLYLSILHIETTGATRRPEPNNSVSGRVPDESLPVFRWSSEVQHDTVTMKRIIQI
jgi:hypothetical protein